MGSLSNVRILNATDNLVPFLSSITKEKWEDYLKRSSFAEIGNQFFSNLVENFSHLQALENFIKVLTACDTFVFVRQHMKNWKVQGELSLKQLLIKCFAHYIATIWKTSDDFKIYHAEYYSDSILLPVLPLLATYNFPHKVKFWENMGLERLGNNLHRDFVTIVRKMADCGVASMEVIVFCLRTPFLQPHRPNGYRLLCQALLMGKVSSVAIEEMFATTSLDEIRSGRMALLFVGKLAQSFESYRKASLGFFQNSDDSKSMSMYQSFKENYENLMSELKNEIPNDNRMELKRAQQLISETATKFYQQRSICKNQLADVLREAMVQHPGIRDFIVDTLKSKGTVAEQDVSFWMRVDSCKINMKDLPFVSDDISNIYVNPSANSMTLPVGVELIMVLGDTGIDRMEAYFQFTLAKFPLLPYLGIDSEWTMYCRKTKANLLQISGITAVFLIDLDAFDQTQLTRCFDLIFGSQYAIFKIGYQYQADLVQLRRTAPLVKSLYEPFGVVCISRLISSLNYQAPVQLVQFFKPYDQQHFPRLSPKLNHNHSEFSEENLRSMGLSKLTETLLGCRLDKSEQRSVWNRRPLTKSQQRYAAIDAYVLINIMHRLLEFCTRFNINLVKMARQLSEPSTPPPFMLASECDPLIHQTLTISDVLPPNYQN